MADTFDIYGKGVQRRVEAQLDSGELSPATHSEDGRAYPEIKRPLIIDPPALGEHGLTNLIFVGRLPMDRRVRVLRNIETAKHTVLVYTYEW